MHKCIRDIGNTTRFHVDDATSSHILPKVNDKFHQWMNRNYGKHGEVKAFRGKVHVYLGMAFDFRTKKKLKLRMDDYTDKWLENFPIDLKSTDIMMTPAGNNLFELGHSKLLSKERKEQFHTNVAKGMFIAKRARPDIQPTVAVLATRVREPNESDWQKLLRLMKYMNGSQKKHLTLSIDDMKSIKWYVDASFAVHPDFKSHTGAVMMMGEGAMQSLSIKQKLNTKASAHAELVGVDDASVYILWTLLFLEEHGYKVKKNTVYQDNKSAILLEINM